MNNQNLQANLPSDAVMDLLGRLQAFDSTLPVIVMTAWANIELAVDALVRNIAGKDADDYYP